MKHLANHPGFKQILTRESSTKRMKTPDKHGMTAVDETPLVCPVRGFHSNNVEKIKVNK